MIRCPKRDAARLWAFRARAELEAAARFARFARELARSGASAVVVDLAGEAASDERRHHTRCVDLAERFGARDLPSVENVAGPLHSGLTDGGQQLLFEVVAMSCITESLSTALLLEMRKTAEDEAVRAVVQEILRDEVQHARLGWAHLAAESQRGSVAFLAPLLPAMLAATIDDELFAEGEGARDRLAGLAGLGGLPRSVRCDVFVSTMNEVVFPGLRRFGVDTVGACGWLADRRSAALG